MEVMLFIKRKYHENVGTPLQILKLVDLEVKHRVNHSSACHDAEKKREIHLNTFHI